MSDRQWWAQYKGRKVGPAESRDAAALLYWETYPTTKAKEVMTGYGTFGPSFDIQWRMRVSLRDEVQQQTLDKCLADATMISRRLCHHTFALSAWRKSVELAAVLRSLGAQDDV